MLPSAKGTNKNDNGGGDGDSGAESPRKPIDFYY
ncbi:unnamed protein product, partial [Cercopithifilaria johnstoni]